MMTSVFVALIGAIGASIVAVIETRKGRRATERATAVSVSEHRDSTDRLDHIATELREMRRDIGGLREEIRHERRERLQLENQVLDHLKEKNRHESNH
ncbi:hypothetical protein [Mycolicibacterium sp.]|uniref:hypothetical protein n=1 Tax=Mycolicibacterium sp. TaxID=2320850 RepID=UPI00355DAFB2